jgi:PAP2 superfamily
MRRTILPALTAVVALALAPALTVIAGAASADDASRSHHRASPADSVLAWNVIAANAVLAAGKFPPEGLVQMSYVQGAVYDAVVAIDGGYRPYVGHPHGPSWASVDAAVATAAHAVLVTHLPTQQGSVEAAYATALAAIPDGPAKSAGVSVGAAAAQQLLAARANDGLNAPIGYSFGSGPGIWVLPTDNVNPIAQTPQTPWLAQMRPFLIESAGQFRPGPPPALGSARYARDVNETEAYGSKTSTVRTTDQTEAARFWTANGVGPDNEAIRRVAVKQGMDAVQAARALTMNDMVEADSLIACFDAKYHYSFWRPYTAIHNADLDGNPATTADSTWLPLAPTPNHPEYPAAHSCVTEAEAEVFVALLGTRTIDVDISSPVTGTTRHFATVTQLETEIINARIWGGMHYRNSGEVGIALGRAVARAGLDDHFEPTD